MNDFLLKPLRLTLVISTLRAGGAERVLSILANHWVSKDWNVTIITFDYAGCPPFYKLHTRIQLIPLGLLGVSNSLWQSIVANIKRLFILRRAIAASKPEVVLSFMDRTNILVLIATRGLSVPVLVSERIHPTSAPLGWIPEILRRLVYPMAAAIVTLTQRTANSFPKFWQHKITVIQNPVLPTEEFVLDEPRHQSALTVVALGRLVPQKGFDLLIDAFSQLAEEYRDWRLVILGEGPLRLDLENLAQLHGIADRVIFPGVVHRPETYFHQADLFVLSSRFEGFPNALCEAMACGLPVISADCETGPREIVRPGIDGLLVEPENAIALSHAMGSLMGDEARRHEMSVRAREVTSRFSLDQVSSQWDFLLRRVICTKE